MNLKKDTYNITLTTQADHYLKTLSRNNKNDVKILIETIKEIPKNPFVYNYFMVNLKEQDVFEKVNIGLFFM